MHQTQLFLFLSTVVVCVSILDKKFNLMDTFFIFSCFLRTIGPNSEPVHITIYFAKIHLDVILLSQSWSSMLSLADRLSQENSNTITALSTDHTRWQQTAALFWFLVLPLEPCLCWHYICIFQQLRCQTVDEKWQKSWGPLNNST
jgi:hypothetical protein